MRKLQQQNTKEMTEGRILLHGDVIFFFFFIFFILCGTNVFLKPQCN